VTQLARVLMTKLAGLAAGPVPLGLASLPFSTSPLEQFTD
jgi:hypothetical protein